MTWTTDQRNFASSVRPISRADVIASWVVGAVLLASLLGTAQALGDAHSVVPAATIAVPSESTLCECLLAIAS